MSFEQLALSPPLLRALRDEGYARPTPIQERAIPPLLAGRDLLGCAQTGTGKTAAFALPILQRLAQRAEPAPRGRPIRALIVTPTRELAAQIAESFRAYGRHLHITGAVVFGGVGQRPQEDAIKRGIDVLVATPGRLLDLMQQGVVRLGGVEVLVLDEADRMLDMGFINDVKKIVAAVPMRRQTLLFSATMPPAIQSLADGLLRDPVAVRVAPQGTAAETVDQRVYPVAKGDKPALLEHLLADPAVERALVFTRTKHGANRVAERLVKAGVGAAAIHGNKSQGARLRALAQFKSGAVRVLVASDLAARGLDIDEISHVINFEIPNEPETYIHRIGRTGRAGAAGRAISFCSVEERGFLNEIERLMRKKIPPVFDHPFAAGSHKMTPKAEPDDRGRRGRREVQGDRARGGRLPASGRTPANRGDGHQRRAGTHAPQRRPAPRVERPAATGGARRAPERAGAPSYGDVWKTDTARRPSAPSGRQRRSRPR
jgi:ATP-dependent RNA helicase RhlE